MPTDEFLNLLEEDNEYVRRKHNTLKREKRPKFNSIEELRTYYHSRPLDEAISDLDKLFLD